MSVYEELGQSMNLSYPFFCPPLSSPTNVQSSLIVAKRRIKYSQAFADVAVRQGRTIHQVVRGRIIDPLPKLQRLYACECLILRTPDYHRPIIAWTASLCSPLLQLVPCCGTRRWQWQQRILCLCPIPRRGNLLGHIQGQGQCRV